MASCLLVGSMNLESADAVFDAVGATLGSEVRRVPDGETGERLGWIFHLARRFAAVETLGLATTVGWDEKTGHSSLPGFQQFQPRPGVPPEAVRFGNLGYADDAIASYERFVNAIERGILPADVRFQVSIPTAYMMLASHIELEHRDALAPAFERALGEEISRMLATIPANRLAIQWDCPSEVSVAEAAPVGPPITWDFDDVARGLGRLATLVPDGVDLGYHLCYGDPPDKETKHGKHWMEPSDAAAMVRLTNAMLEFIDRPVDWVHMPVPIERDDDRYFQPLRDLRLRTETQLYLGLVHLEDGVEGTQRRIDVAARHVAEFGVATECGLGRLPRDEVVPTLRIHHEVQVPVQH
jgi:hypothetical protein